MPTLTPPTPRPRTPDDLTGPVGADAVEDADRQAFFQKFFAYLDGELPPEDLPGLQHDLDHCPQANRLALDAMRLDHMLRKAFAE